MNLHIDIQRHFEKVAMALEHTEAYLTRQNEANAALHLSDRVLYSPLTTEVINAREALRLAVTALENE